MKIPPLTLFDWDSFGLKISPACLPVPCTAGLPLKGKVKDKHRRREIERLK